MTYKKIQKCPLKKFTYSGNLRSVCVPETFKSDNKQKKVTEFCKLLLVIINLFANKFSDFYFLPSSEHSKLGTCLATKNCYKNAEMIPPLFYINFEFSKFNPSKAKQVWNVSNNNQLNAFNIYVQINTRFVWHMKN